MRGYDFSTIRVNLFLTLGSVLRINNSDAQRKLVGKDVLKAVDESCRTICFTDIVSQRFVSAFSLTALSFFAGMRKGH